ncbi:MAG: hypothetical protein K2Y28_05335, partial [Burkholderiaceae bacterium]|nr:hypothetical protein [Burkholderiaceae bacterium]
MLTTRLCLHAHPNRTPNSHTQLARPNHKPESQAINHAFTPINPRFRHFIACCWLDDLSGSTV